MVEVKLSYSRKEGEEFVQIKWNIILEGLESHTEEDRFCPQGVELRMKKFIVE